MERLTMRDVAGRAFWVSPQHPGGGYRLTGDPNDLERLDKIAAYEDTGLEPEQAQLISNVLREVGETYNCWFDYVVNCVLDNSHLKELAQAEKDGRLVVLDAPRKPLVWGDDAHDSIFMPKL